MEKVLGILEEVIRDMQRSLVEPRPIHCVCGSVVGNKLSGIKRRPGRTYCEDGSVICIACGGKRG